MNAAQIVRIISLLVAVVAAFVVIPYAVAILAVLGLVAGFIGVEVERRQLVLVMAIALATVAGGLGTIPMVGTYLTAILTNVSAVLNGLAIAVIATIVYERVKG